MHIAYGNYAAARSKYGTGYRTYAIKLLLKMIEAYAIFSS
jgi:hypothetical protein